MASMNKVIIMGNLGQDPELRYTQSQIPVATLNVATTDYRTSPDGQKSENTEWHRIVVWRKQAENCSKYLAKGSSVLVEGKLTTRSWEDQNGQKRYTTEIVANNVQFLSRGGASAGRGEDQSYQQQGNYNQPQDNGGGFPQANMNQPTPSFGGPDTPSLDDIPF